MVRKIKNQNANRRVRRSRRSRRTARVKQTAIPPIIDFRKVGFNTTLRYCQEIEVKKDAKYVSEVSIFNLFENGPWRNLKEVFSEVKVHDIKIWLLPNLSALVQGQAVLVVSPPEEVEINQSTSFMMLAACPGAHLNRIGSRLHAIWKPTEPTERDWFKMDDGNRKILRICISNKNLTSKDTVNAQSVKYDVVIDVRASLRGVNYKAMIGSSILQPDLTLEFDCIGMQ